MTDALWFVVVVAVLLALSWLGWRYEPHWCSKDGQRFTCRTRVLEVHDHRRAAAARSLQQPRATLLGAFGGMGAPGGQGGAFAQRWRDARVFVDGDGVQLVARVGPVRRALPTARVLARADTPEKRRWVYVVESDPLRELRVPVTSRAVPVLDELVTRSSGNAPGAPR